MIVQTVDNGSAENVNNVDVVQNNSSSNATLVVEFTRYFQNNVDVDDMDHTEVPPPTSRDYSVSKGKTGYDENNSDYDTKEDIEGYEGEYD